MTKLWRVLHTWPLFRTTCEDSIIHLSCVETEAQKTHVSKTSQLGSNQFTMESQGLCYTTHFPFQEPFLPVAIFTVVVNSSYFWRIRCLRGAACDPEEISYSTMVNVHIWENPFYIQALKHAHTHTHTHTQKLGFSFLSCPYETKG
jgi:hypothetical protein